jgi:hypothetical protein
MILIEMTHVSTMVTKKSGHFKYVHQLAKNLAGATGSKRSIPEDRSDLYV